MGWQTRPLISAFVQCFIQDRFSAIVSCFRWWPDFIRESDERLCYEKLIEERLIDSQRLSDRRAAPTSTMHRIETELLTTEENPIRQTVFGRETLSRAERLFL